MYSTSLLVVFLCATTLQLTNAMEISEFWSYLDANGARLCAADKPSEEVAASSEISCGTKCTSEVSCMFFTFQKTTKNCRLYNNHPTQFDKVEGCLSFVSKVTSS